MSGKYQKALNPVHRGGRNIVRCLVGSQVFLHYKHLLNHSLKKKKILGIVFPDTYKMVKKLKMVIKLNNV